MQSEQEHKLSADQRSCKAQLNGSLAWRAGFEDRKDKGKKSLWEAMIVIEKFAAWEALEDYELLKLPSGKPAIELSFSLHARDGFKHYGHMDIGLVHIHLAGSLYWS